ncbi:MAG: hypothetical protein WAW23_01455 [Candidatus Methanoperedens sp.]
MWATPTGATVDVDAPLRNIAVLDSHTTRMAVPYVDTPSRGVTLEARDSGRLSAICFVS